MSRFGTVLKCLHIKWLTKMTVKPPGNVLLSWLKLKISHIRSQWHSSIHLYNQGVLMEEWESSFLPWNALYPVCFFWFCCHFLLLCCSAHGPTHYVAHLLEEQKHHFLLSDTVCGVCVCVGGRERERERETEHERASSPCVTKQSVRRPGNTEREAEVVRWPDTVGKKRQHYRTRQQRILPLFPHCTLLTPSNSTFQLQGGERGLLADTQWIGCMNWVLWQSMRPYSLRRQ